MKNLFKIIIVIILILLYNYRVNNSTPINVPSPEVIVPKPEVIPSPVIIPVPKINLVDIKPYRTIEEKNTIYSDVINHVKKPYGDQAGRPTNVHESVHHIVSDIRRQYINIHGDNIIGLYYGKGKAILLQHPNIKIRDVSVRIPNDLRSYRYQLYFVSQLRDWNNYPLYILDEWTAYIWGGSCALEDYNQNRKVNIKTDAVSGCLDFTIYTLYLVLTIKEKDLNYWNTNEQFKLTIKHYLEIAEKTFFEGKDIFKVPSQTQLFEKFKQLPDNHEIKQLLIQDFDSLFIRKL